MIFRESGGIVRHPLLMPLVLRLCLTGCLLLAAAARAEVNDLRFTVSLKPEERASIGLARLT